MWVRRLGRDRRRGAERGGEQGRLGSAMGGQPSKSTGISSSRVVDCEHVPNPYDTAGCALPASAAEHTPQNATLSR